jgi:hypothetical protein
VTPLHQAIDRIDDREFQRAARQAIVRIHSRLGRTSRGQLSLASDGTGQVSLSDDDAEGRLTFPDEPRD